MLRNCLQAYKDIDEVVILRFADQHFVESVVLPLFNSPDSKKTLTKPDLSQLILKDILRLYKLPTLDTQNDKRYYILRIKRTAAPKKEDVKEDLVKKFRSNTFLHLAILLNLPTITEVRRTLDDASFYKIGDLSQVLYVFQGIQIGSKDLLQIQEEIKKDEVQPGEVEDELEMRAVDRIREHYQNQDIFKTSELRVNRVDRELRKYVNWNFYKKYRNQGYSDYKFQLRNGLTPGTKNAASKRYSKPIIEDPQKVYKVEGQLKTIIDYGFSERVEEELLTFDQEGKLQDVQSANIDIIAHKAEMSKKQQHMAEKYNRRKKGNMGRIIRIDDPQGNMQSSEDVGEYESDDDEESDDVNEDEIKEQIVQNEALLLQKQKELGAKIGRGEDLRGIKAEIEQIEQVLMEFRHYLNLSNDSESI